MITPNRSLMGKFYVTKKNTFFFYPPQDLLSLLVMWVISYSKNLDQISFGNIARYSKAVPRILYIQTFTTILDSKINPYYEK